MTNDHPARVVVFDSFDNTVSLSLHFSKLLKAAAISNWTVLVFSQLAVAQTFSNRHELFSCLCRPFHMFASLHAECSVRLRNTKLLRFRRLTNVGASANNITV